MNIYDEVKDPDETKDYAFDWSAKLVAGETIDAFAVALIDAAGTTNPSNSQAGGVTRVWLSGGTAGRRCLFTVQVTTSGGRTLEEAFGVDIVDAVIGPAVTIQRGSAEIAAELAQFRAARAALVSGQRVADVWRDGRRVTYSESSLNEITAAIADLTREYEAAVAVEAGSARRRPIGLAWRN